jgi:DNA ligase-1
MTQKYPDIMSKVEQISRPAVESYVLDCEVVAYNPSEHKILPFQILSTRKRKDVTASSIEVEVCLFAFDLLFLNGQSLIEEPFRTRRQLLHEHFVDVPGEFHFAQYADSTSVEEIQVFLEESIKGGCEGLMIKTLDAESSYEPSRRSRKWLKVKKDYLDGVGDSLDLVVIGGYAGRGKRTGVYGGYLLACYDPSNEEYQAICKIGTGFSEADLELQAAFFKNHTIPAPKPYYRVTDTIRPDVWFEPVQVWEVKAADFSLSPVYTAAWGLVDSGKGISLRFPRYIKVRDDKGPEDASAAAFVADMYNNQALMTSKDSRDFDEDY